MRSGRQKWLVFGAADHSAGAIGWVQWVDQSDTSPTITHLGFALGEQYQAVCAAIGESDRYLLKFVKPNTED